MRDDWGWVHNVISFNVFHRDTAAKQMVDAYFEDRPLYNWMLRFIEHQKTKDREAEHTYNLYTTMLVADPRYHAPTKLTQDAARLLTETTQSLSSKTHQVLYGDRARTKGANPMKLTGNSVAGQMAHSYEDAMRNMSSYYAVTITYKNRNSYTKPKHLSAYWNLPDRGFTYIPDMSTPELISYAYCLRNRLKAYVKEVCQSLGRNNNYVDRIDSIYESAKLDDWSPYWRHIKAELTRRNLQTIIDEVESA